MRKLASIRLIDGIYPIDGADRIELAQVDSWFVIVKKDEFKVGDKIVYIEIDSLLPSDNPEFAFMERYKYRVKTIKMRGVYSQGLIFSTQIVPPKITKMGYNVTVWEPYELGADVTDVLKIVKYEPPETFENAPHSSTWDNDTPKTDEERVQNLGKKYAKYQKIDDVWIQSVKLDGTSVTYQLIDGVFRVFSHNCEIPPAEGSLWEWAINNQIEQKMRSYCCSHNMPENIALQGEMVGPGIQQNRQQYESKTVKFFYIFDRNSKQYFAHDDFISAICDEMGLETVPILSDTFNISDYSVAQLLDMAEKYDVESSTRQEGFVFYTRKSNPVVNVDEFHSLITPSGRISFKVKSNKYVLDFESR